jgi:NTE family protein
MTVNGPDRVGAGVAMGTSAAAAGSPKVVDLVLEGGGVKGIGLVGAISVLEDDGYTFTRVAGTSAGAIVGSLVAGGMSAMQLHDLISSLDYNKFKDETFLDHVGDIGKLVSLWGKEGIYSGNYFHGWIREQLAGLGVDTFSQLQIPGSEGLALPQRYKLVVMASDVTQGSLLHLPWDYPDDPDARLVADAVRASMSIPFFYRPMQLDLYGQTSVIVDGGMLSNFPIDVFDPTENRAPVLPTIGIKLSARQKPDQIEHRVKGDYSLAMGMLDTMQSWNDQMHLDNPEVTSRTIFVDTLGISPVDFDIDKDTQSLLFENGRTAAEKFLAAQ